MHYWLHRITGGSNAIGFSYPLLFNNNLLSIGWSDLSDKAFLDDVIKNGDKAIYERMEKMGWGRPRNRSNLKRFLCDMKKGDKVVVPTPKTFSVFEITSDKIYCNETIDSKLYKNLNATYIDGCFKNECGDIDLGFYREVKLISEREMSREYFADQALYSRMKVRQTNLCIDDLSASVEKALKSSAENKPINLKDEIADEFSQKLLEKINELVKDNSFEALVGNYLKSIGGEVQTPSRNESSTEDGDADKVAFFEKLKTVVMVQVKKHKETTGDWAVNQIRAFGKNHNYGDEYFTQLWVISTCDDFSQKAQSLASENGVRLITGREFCRMILESGISCLNG